MMMKFKYFLPFLLCIALNLNANSNNAFIKAGKDFKLNPKLLWAIAYKESRFNPKAINRANNNKTYDIGIMQINSAHLAWLKKDYGISEKDLFTKPKLNIYVGALILRKCFDKHGANLNGLTCYNGRIKNNPYGKSVLAILEKQEKKIQRQKIAKALLAKNEKDFVKVLNQRIENE